MRILLILFAWSSILYAESVRAPLRFISNTLADYVFVRPSPGDEGEKIFRTLCTSTPPGCEKKHPAPGIPIACAIAPQYQELEQGVHTVFKRVSKPEFQKDEITIEQLFLAGPHSKANELPVKKHGEIIAWKWNESIKEELEDYLRELEKTKEMVDLRLKAFEYRMINDLRHEQYHVDRHFIPFFNSLERLFNGVEYSDVRRREWIVNPEDPIPEREIHKALQDYLNLELKKLENTRQLAVDRFHEQQDSYSNHARYCACYGDLDSCKKMDTFWSY